MGPSLPIIARHARKRHTHFVVRISKIYLKCVCGVVVNWFCMAAAAAVADCFAFFAGVANINVGFSTHAHARFHRRSAGF